VGNFYSIIILFIFLFNSFILFYLFSQSHIADTVTTPGAAAHQAAQHKIAKYSL